MVVRIEFAPHGLVAFRKPSGFGGFAHGPGTGGESLDYPLPSTLAGVLAGIAYSRGLCNPSVADGGGEWSDTRECLGKLLGKDFHLYSGLAVIRGYNDGGETLLYYTQHGYASGELIAEYYRLLALGKGGGNKIENNNESDSNIKEGQGSGCVKEEEFKRNSVRIPRLEYTGIALNRASKTVLEEHLYTTVFLDPGSIGLSFTLLSNKAGKLLDVNGETVKIGGEGKTATLKVEDTGKSVHEYLILNSGGENCREWILLLISPALLDAPPWSEGEAVVLDEQHAKTLGKFLLSQIVQNNMNEYVKSITIPKTEPSLTILYPGWSMASNKPRKPYLFVPPGTLLKIEAEKKVIEELVASGLGVHTDLGWGTIVATCIG